MKDKNFFFKKTSTKEQLNLSKPNSAAEITRKE